MVWPPSCSCWVSPTHRIGTRRCLTAARTLRFISSSLSPKTWRRSEWPRMTWVTPNALSIGAETSPVNAPLSSKCMFCAPSAIDRSGEFLRGRRDRRPRPARPARRDRARAPRLRDRFRARSARDQLRAPRSASRFIFQFPASIFLRIALSPRVRQFPVPISQRRGRCAQPWLSSALTPGNSMPSRYSSVAPPPVEIWREARRTTAGWRAPRRCRRRRLR